MDAIDRLAVTIAVPSLSLLTSPAYFDGLYRVPEKDLHSKDFLGRGGVNLKVKK